APVGVVGDPVAGHPGNVLHHRLATAEDPVDQRGLAHVGAADDGHHGRRAVGRLRLPVPRGQAVHTAPASAGARATIRATTSARDSPVESISTASPAMADWAASRWSRRAWSASVCAAVTCCPPASSAVRRSARTAALAVRYTLTGASRGAAVPDVA